MQERRLNPRFGTEVSGLDVSKPLGDQVLAKLHRILIERQVIVIKAPGLVADQLLGLAQQFGEPESHAFHPHLEGALERVQLLDSAEQAPASMWHADESFLPSPPAVTLLHAQIIPDTGGDTCFASMAAAYEVMSPAMKKYLTGLRAAHDLAKLRLLEYRNGRIDAGSAADGLRQQRLSLHPVVRSHPLTRLPSIFVNPLYTTHIQGVEAAESEAILEFLYRHSTSPTYTLRHRWQVGDLVIWDNRCTIHMALGDFSGHRRMHRISVLGDEPQPAA
jgi:taurine dioxygenase